MSYSIIDGLVIHYICGFTKEVIALCSLLGMLYGTISMLFHNWCFSDMLNFWQYNLAYHIYFTYVQNFWQWWPSYVL